ncbi:MAG: hypothetical protein ABFQ53_03830, partial [Patescibacteria group bacterium]
AIIDIAPTIDYYIVSQNRQNYMERLTQQKLSRNPQYKIRLDKLYQDNVPTEYELLPNNRDSQFIRIINGKNVNIITN